MATDHERLHVLHIDLLTHHPSKPGHTEYGSLSFRIDCPYVDLGKQRPCATYLENMEPQPEEPVTDLAEPRYRNHRWERDGQPVADDDPWIVWFGALDDYESWTPTDECWVKQCVEEFAGEQWNWPDDVRLSQHLELPRLESRGSEYSTFPLQSPLLVDWHNSGGIEDSQLVLYVRGVADGRDR